MGNYKWTCHVLLFKQGGGIWVFKFLITFCICLKNFINTFLKRETSSEAKEIRKGGSPEGLTAGRSMARAGASQSETLSESQLFCSLTVVWFEGQVN